MADTKAQFLPLLATVASAFLLSVSVQSTPQPPSISSSRAPPQLPQYYPTSSQRPPSSPYPPSSSSLAPTSPVYTAQRIRPNSYSDSAEYDDPYPASAHLGTARTTSGVARGEEEDAPENTGFVEPIDFSSLLKDVGSSPKGVGLDIGASNTNPLFASESKDTFQGFFGSTKNPFEELSRLNTASSDHNSRRQNGEEDNVGFVDPNVQFRSLFDSAGPSASSTGFRPQDFLGSKSENIGSDPSKGSQTRAYPSFTYSGRKDGGDREDSDRDDGYYGRGDGGGGGPNRYRSSYRQVGDGGGSGGNYYPPTSDSNPDYYGSPGGGGGSDGPYDDYDRISNDSPPDSYDDDRRGGGGGGGGGPSYYASSPGPSSRGGGGGYERATPRYSPAAQETSNSPQTKPRAAESKNPRCKKVEKSVDYGDDHASFTDPEPDYDPSTYQGRYKRQARQRGGRGGSKRPMTCYVCEDEHGRYAEKCSYDSKGSPSNNNGNYFHSESSSFSDNGRRPSSGSGGGKSKERPRRNPGGGNRQRHYSSGDTASAESTTKSVSAIAPVNLAEVGESEPKVIEKRQSGSGGYDDDFGENHRGGEQNDPYNARTGAYSHPTGYEGPPLSHIGGAATNRGGGGGGGYHGGGGRGGGGGGGYHGDGGYHGGRGGGGGGGGGNDGYDSDFNFGSAPDYESEAAQSTREFDFSIPREFDPDVQLGPQGNRGGGGGSSRGQGPHGGGGNSRGPSPHGGGGDNSFQPQYQHSPNRRSGPQQSTSSSNRREALDDFDIGYNDYIKQNFPEAFNSPSFGAGSSPSYSHSPSNHEFTPNYYHRPRSGNNGGGGGGRHHDDDRGHSPEVSHSSPSDNYGRSHRGGGGGYGHGGGHRGGHGGFVPEKQHTQPSHNFAPPPGFFSEDSPGNENYENLGKIMNDFSSRSRDGCQKVNKGDMTCYVCRDAKGMKKEECMYASNDPKNKAMAYHEVAEYSSPTASVLPAPLHATLLGQSAEDSPIFSSEQEDSDQDGDSSTLSAEASSVFLTSTPAATDTSHDDKKTKSASTSTLVTAKAPLSSSASVLKARKIPSSSSSKDKDKDKKKNVHSVKSSRILHSSTVIVHERSKRSVRQAPNNRKIQSEENYDFDY